MTASQLESLKEMTVIVADTGDIQSIEQFVPRDATTNPSLITAAAAMPAYAEVVDDALRFAKQKVATGDTAKIVAVATDRLAIEFGLRILKIIPGRVSTEVDARLSFDTQATVAKAKELIAAYEAAGVARSRVLVKIAATWEGIMAAKELEAGGIHCNLTLLFGFHQAVACAEANVTLISPFVGRILDWHKKTHNRDFVGAEDPGVQSVTRIYNYYKTYGYTTEVMGASFRNTGEIVELAGCDLLTISPKLLSELQATNGTLSRKLAPTNRSSEAKLSLNESQFRAMHAEDAMATDKLAEGIDGFAKAIVELEGKLAARLATL